MDSTVSKQTFFGVVRLIADSLWKLSFQTPQHALSSFLFALWHAFLSVE